MHVLVLPSWYKTPDSPLNGSFFREQAIALAKAGCQVSLLHWYNDAPGKAYFEEFDDEGIRTVFIHYKRSPLHINFLIQRYYVKKAFRRFWKDAPPDIIHVHSHAATKYARFFAKKYRIPYVVTEHSSAYARNLLSDAAKKEIRKGLGSANRVIAVSNGLKTHIQPYCRKPVIVIPNMVSNCFWSASFPPAAPSITAESPFRFLSVGYLTRNKGMDSLLSAFARLAERHPPSELVIGGGGEEEAALKAQAVELGIADKVRFLGNIPRGEVRRQMEQAQAFVLSSRVETFGIVLIEALACGKPVIMTATDASQTIVNDGNGVVVPVDDVSALAEQMAQMIDHYSQYDPVAIREDCRRRFSEAAVSQKIIDVYQEVLAEK